MSLTDLEHRVEALEVAVQSGFRCGHCSWFWITTTVSPGPPQAGEQEKCCAASGTYACVCNRYAVAPQPSEQERDNAVLFHAFRNLREILAGMDTTTAPSRLTVALIRTHLANIEREIALPAPPQASRDGVPVEELNRLLSLATAVDWVSPIGPFDTAGRDRDVAAVRAWLVSRGQG